MTLKHVTFLLLLFCFTTNGIRYEFDDTIAPIVERRRAQVFAAADGCVASLGTSLGEDFLTCVLEDLRSAEEKYKQREAPDKEDDDPFPVPFYDLRPLTFDESDMENDAVVRHARMLPDLLRNYTCARIQDGSSRPVSTESWTYDEKAVLEQIDEQICTAAHRDDGDDYIVIEGYLPDGDDVDSQDGMDVEEAKAHCDSLPLCGAFTMSNTLEDDGAPPTVFFKGHASVDNTGPDKEWRSYIRRQLPARCLSDKSETPPMNYSRPQEYAIEIIRHEPFVAIVPNFATDQECEELVNAGGSDQDMSRAFEGYKNGVDTIITSYRRSFSSNIHVDHEDRTNTITRFTERMFAFVRRVTGYEVYGPGQEPISAVLYKDVGDENRPHCDGLCHGEPHVLGSRVATSIVYCAVPEVDGQPAGGQTSFTRSGLMVAPKKGDLLLFAYKTANNTMDTGFTEHSGCKILGGRKWIAVQWYREGLDYERPWHTIEGV